MKLFLFCTFIAILGQVRSLDLECEPYLHSDATSCEITEPVTIKPGEKVNIVSKVNLNAIREITFITEAVNRSQISMVPSEIFQQLPNLETFALYASLNVLNKGDFEKAGKLKRLTIDNQIKKIPAGVLGSAKNLENLTLSNNKIAEIEDNAFNGLNALLSIELQNNRLTIIKRNTFNGLEKLEYLVLAYNQIELIEENALNLPNLMILAVSFNRLTHLPDNLFSAVPLLKILHANNNQINHIGKSLYGLKNLDVLALSHNKPTGIDLVAFSQLPVLNYLYLDEIGLTSDNISKIKIKEPSKSVLSYLGLVNNELTSNDDWKKFAKLFPQLGVIDVMENKYPEIDLGNKTLRQQFPKLFAVFVSSATWNSDWLKNFVENSRKDGIDIF